LEHFGLNFIDLKQDLIDLVWVDERPLKPKTKIEIHDIKYAGLSWQQKMDKVIERLKLARADVFVVTALDDIACN
jgi:Xaa-Pro aminopeptidase